MHLKQLEMTGFKSFAQRVRLQFGHGITGVVGPNGCGKSNIVDAIRWCMGETSAKNLRGRAMQDVIFAGSDRRAPLGLAEVTLTFAHEGQVPPGYLTGADMAVTRRLHRDGTSEYLLNKTHVRLRDITDLFLGTGVGTRAYSIIEQGHIGFIIHARPEERRSLIEEVAGITKFKVRKQAAQRRMDATEANLARLQDVMGELERQLETLRRQAEQAERYRQLKAELQDVALHGAALEILRMAGLEKVHQAHAQQVHDQLEDAQRRWDAQQTQLEADRLKILSQEQELQAQQQASAALDATVAALERDVVHGRDKLQDSRKRAQHAGDEGDDALRRLEQAQEEKAFLEAEQACLKEQAQKDEEELRHARRNVEDSQARIVELDEELQSLRQEALTCGQQLAEHRAQALHMERQSLEKSHRQQQAQAEQEKLRAQQAQVQARCTEFQERQRAVQSQLEEDHNRLRCQRAELEAWQVQLRALASDVAHLQEVWDSKRLRLASLEEIAQRLEGYADGVRTLWGSAPSGEGAEGASFLNPNACAGLNPNACAGLNPNACAGLEALVSGCLDVPSVYERALEAVLSERLQYSVVDTPEHAAQAVAYLKAHGGGRSGFIPRGVKSVAVAGAFSDGPGVIGAALDHIHVDSSFKDIAAFLLADVVLVDTLETALRLQSAFHDSVRGSVKGSVRTWVSLEGDVVEAGGIVVGGSHQGAGLLGSQRERRELKKNVEALGVQLHAAQDAYAAWNQRCQARQGDLQQLSADVHRLELESLTVSKDTEAAHRESQQLEERLHALTLHIAQDTGEIAHLQAQCQAVSEAMAAASSQQEDIQARLSERQERRYIQASQLTALSETLTALQVRWATSKEKIRSWESAWQRWVQSTEALAQRREQGNAALAYHRAQAQELEARIAEGEGQLDAHVRSAQALQSDLAEARACYEAVRSHLVEQEAALKDLHHGIQKLQETGLGLCMQLQKLELERQRLVEDILERYDVSLWDVVGNYHLRALPSASQARQRELLERRIKSMGPVNLMAIEECAQLDGRYRFLTQQRDDLHDALTSLKRAVSQINRSSRERFREAFDAVNAMFQKVYPRLFRGGTARLELTQEDDLLETGIEVVAMPPGKKLQSMGLLSGGEKALTATALIFSIFLIKPSPFCILDEVDAPLDDTNVVRFNTLLQEISKISQCIVITHNKQTMVEADRLYGITMQEPGMSKVVAVDLQDRPDKQPSKEQAA